jgi:hypothetical protein
VSVAVLVFAPSFTVAQTTPDAAQHSAPDPDRVDAQARKVLETGLKLNGLVGNDGKRWHLKIDFQEAFNFVEGRKFSSGSMEEWYGAPYQWRRTYTGDRTGWTGSEWSVSKVERYAKGVRHEELDDYALMFRIARPLMTRSSDANIKPTDRLLIRRRDASDMS